jgi:hypothetical protein
VHTRTIEWPLPGRLRYHSVPKCKDERIASLADCLGSDCATGGVRLVHAPMFMAPANFAEGTGWT